MGEVLQGPWAGNGVIVVGSDGYIGSRLCPALRQFGYDVDAIDCGVYSNVPAAYKRDVRELDPPGDGRPVVWLATIHREPEGFDSLPVEGQRKWLVALEDIAFTQLERWIRAGHPLVFPSSMQVMELMGPSRYGLAKRMVESRWVAQRGVQIVRFGTVWGGFNTEGPIRAETAINSALLGRTLTDNYLAFTTHIDRAVTAILCLLPRQFLGTVENVLDSEDPVTGPEINEIVETYARERSSWQQSFMLERGWAERRASEFKKPRKHFTRALAEYYCLPWPEGTAGEWKV